VQFDNFEMNSLRILTVSECDCDGNMTIAFVKDSTAHAAGDASDDAVFLAIAFRLLKTRVLAPSVL
jgi:hypothetical protein